MSATLEWEQWWRVGAYFTASTLCLNVWDGLLMLNDEMTFIWPMSWTAYTKWLYLFGRYFPLAVEIVSFVFQVLYAHPPLSLLFCQHFRTFGGSAGMVLMLCLNTLLTIRIYALYGLWTWCSGIATFAVLAEFGAMFASLITTISEALYDPACIFAPVPESVLPYLVGSFASQITLVWLAFRKRDCTSGRLSIAYVTIRDGTLAFMCICGFLVLLFICRIFDSPLTSLMVYWLPVICSISICHIILNIQHSAMRLVPDQFTSGVLDLDGSADSYLITHLELRSRLP